MSTPRTVPSNSSKKHSLVARTDAAPAVESQPFVLPFCPGDVIADKYEVVGVLGAGGVAYVISALHLELGEMVALKFLRPESLVHEEVVARFASEARSVARIKSEHVAHVYDVGTLPDGAPFIVMEHLDGKDLALVLSERGRLPVKLAVDYVLQACEALACAHAGGIVHRDIKPENLFLTQAAGSVECVKVLDFGISKSALAAWEPSGRRRANTMLPMGTPGYMSPEQIRDCGAVDARTDIWALGCVLAELLTGTSAFDAPTLPQLTATILERDPIPLRKLLPEAPPALEALLQKCLEKDPDRRFQDVAELAVALYPFGPRRARVSAERCHHVLKGHQGMVIELSSVAPPPMSGSTPMPVSSTGAVVSAVPASLPPDTVRTSTPASITMAASPAPKTGRRVVAVASLMLVAVAIGVVLGFQSPGASRAHAPGAADARAAARAPSPVQPAAPPPATAEPEPEARPARTIDLDAPSEAAPAGDAEREKASSDARSAKPSRARRAVKAPPPAAKPTATASAPKRRATLDDSEPDVGY
ncbi:MAG TPA: serine/threonine-protein kinase [Polyangiaceae bacterium]